MPKNNFVKNFGEKRLKRLAQDRAEGKTLTELSSFYKISKTRVRKLIEYVFVTPGIISDSIAIEIANVACSNQTPHSKKIKPKRTSNYYDRLFDERRKNHDNQILDRLKEVQYILDNFNEIYDCSSESEKLRETLENEYRELERFLDS